MQRNDGASGDSLLATAIYKHGSFPKEIFVYVSGLSDKEMYDSGSQCGKTV